MSAVTACGHRRRAWQRSRALPPLKAYDTGGVHTTLGILMKNLMPGAPQMILI